MRILSAIAAPEGVEFRTIRPSALLTVSSRRDTFFTFDVFPLGWTDGGQAARWRSKGVQHAAERSSLGKNQSQPRLF